MLSRLEQTPLASEQSTTQFSSQISWNDISSKAQKLIKTEKTFLAENYESYSLILII